MTTTDSNSAIVATELDQRIHNLIAGKTDFFCFKDGMGRLLKVNGYFLTLFQLEKDALLILGKGDEDYQEIKGVKYHFDDREVVREYLAIKQLAVSN